MISHYLDLARFIHSTKTAIAVLIALFLTKFIGFYSDQWIVVSTLFVMCAQIYVGSVIQKSLLRFIGTLIGCLLAILAIVIFASHPLAMTLSVAIISFIAAYVASLNSNLTYPATLGAVTAALILVFPDPTFTIAFARFSEISIGILIAALVSQFILPIHARNHLRASQVKTLQQLCSRYKNLMIKQSFGDVLTGPDMDDDIVKSLTEQRQLAQEAKREPFAKPFNQQSFLQGLRCEREILRCIDFMHRALLAMQQQQTVFYTSAAFTKFNEDIIDAFNVLIQALESKKTVMNVSIPAIDMTVFENLEKSIDDKSTHTLMFIHSFIFSAKILIDNLQKIAVLAKISLIEKAQEEAS